VLDSVLQRSASIFFRLSLSLHTCLRFCGVVRRCGRSSTAAAGEATSCSVLMSL
jgi:hypothetical protein